MCPKTTHFSTPSVPTPAGLPRRAMDLVEEFLELGRKASWLHKNNINSIAYHVSQKGENQSVSLGKHPYFDVYAGTYPQKIP